VQASKIQSQLLHIEQQTDIKVDSEKRPKKVHDIMMLLRELMIKQDNMTLKCRQNYVKKLIECRVERDTTETVRNDLDKLSELSVLERMCERELSLDSISVMMNQKRLNRVNE